MNPTADLTARRDAKHRKAAPAIANWSVVIDHVPGQGTRPGSTGHR
jgi:hypothetical protein